MKPPRRITERPTAVGSPTDATDMEPSPTQHNDALPSSSAPLPPTVPVDAGYIDDVTTVDADKEKSTDTVVAVENAIAMTVAPSAETTAADEKATKTTTTEDASAIVVADEKVTTTTTTTATQIAEVSVI